MTSAAGKGAEFTALSVFAVGAQAQLLRIDPSCTFPPTCIPHTTFRCHSSASPTSAAATSDSLPPLLRDSSPSGTEMSLDQNLFTLNVTPRADDRNIVELVDPKGVVHYIKRRLPTNEYNIEVYGEHCVLVCETSMTQLIVMLRSSLRKSPCYGNRSRGHEQTQDATTAQS